MNELALFAGIGGGLLGSRLLGWKTVCAIEIDPYCREILLRRQEENCLDCFPIWDDIKTFDPEPWTDNIDVVTAGFPCQPFSRAGVRLEGKDHRNLWPETIRTISSIRPKYALLENVPSLTLRGYFSTVIRDITESGYCCVWDNIHGDEVMAAQARERLWILLWREEQDRSTEKGSNLPGNQDGTLADTQGVGVEEVGSLRHEESKGLGPEVVSRWSHTGSGAKVWSREPGVDRLVDGLPYWLERTRTTGNAQIPQMVIRAWYHLNDIKNHYGDYMQNSDSGHE